MALLAFQKPVHVACLKHLRNQVRVPWVIDKELTIPIHPPMVVNASVSSGKSVLIGELTKETQLAAAMKNRAYHAMVLQNQSELCEQNSAAAFELGVSNSTFSASIVKSKYFPVIFGTTGTVARALENAFKDWAPDLLLIDECHTVPWDDPESQFMKIILHFYRIKPHMRVVGYTGSPFRSTDSIIGGYWNLFAHITPEDPLYPAGGIGNAQISTEFMSSTGWVVPCLFGWPEDESESTYDFSKFGVGDNVKDPTEAELDEAVGDIEKLQRICFEIVERTRERKGVLIFGATHRHLRQIKKCLINVGVEPDQIGSITERTKNKERKEILDRAKVGQCKFVLNVGVLTTGVNVPWWDTCCFLRPIASIVLLIQSIGRVLRLLLEKGGPSMVDMDSMTTEERLALIAASEKPDALVLDFGGVMDRLGSLYDNPILEQAIKAHAEKKQETTQCPKCDEVNSIFARRCIGYPGGVRCEHFFKSRICPGCGVENDPVARSCRACNYLLLDPNASLSHKAYSDDELTPVVKRTIKAGAGGSVIVRYVLADGREPFQIYHPGVGSSDQMRKINTTVWRNQFAFKCVQSEEWKFKAGNMKAAAIEKMQAMFSVPTHISARQNDKGKWNIGRMVFRDSGLVEVSADDQIEEGEIA